MASQEEIDKVIEATDIVALVSEYVKLEKSGKGYKGLCPFHNEKTPSFSVSIEKKIAKCMGCGKGGNPITFLKEIKNISFNEALSELAKKNGIQLRNPVEHKMTQDFSKYFEINEVSRNFYIHNLLSTQSGLVAKEYLHKRGINDETIKMFGIGLSSNKTDVLYKVLKENNFIELDMIDLGLVKSGEKGYYDLFTKRIMFPICDEEGNCVGFSGRLYQGEDKSLPKYVNSPETIVFKKSLVLYNLHNAKQIIRKVDRAILHEGFMDVIASTRSGFEESICSMGTALTQEQARLIKKYTNNVIIAYDGDSAGVKASLKAIEIFASLNMQVKLLVLPDGLDPDDFVSQFGTKAYHEYFESNLVDSIEYQYIQSFKNKNIKDLTETELIKQSVFAVIRNIGSQVVVEKYLKRLSDDLDVSYSSLVIDYSSYCNKNYMPNYAENDFNYENNFDNVQNSFMETIVAKRHELRLMNYAKISKDKALYIDSKIKIDALEKKHQILWMKMIDGCYACYEQFSEANYIRLLNSNEYNWYINDIESINRSNLIEPYNDQDLEDCIEYLNNDYYRIQIMELDEKIKIAASTEIKDLFKQKIELLKIYNIKKTQKRKQEI